MKYTLLAGASALAIGLTSPALAGDIILTGHDNDYHCYYGNAGDACAALGAEVSYVQNGSTLPVLAIDADGASGELAGSLADDGISYVAVAPSAVTGAMFDHSKYSAFVVASVSSCGGCDNPTGTGTLLSTYESSIASFFNAGGGILGLSGAADSNAYAYVPESGGLATPIYTSSGFVATAAGTADIPGFFAVNGDETHNIFSGPGSFYTVAETYGVGGPDVTIFGSGGTIGCTGTHCTISAGAAPEPTTWAMLSLGVFGIGAMMRRKKKGAVLAVTA